MSLGLSWGVSPIQPSGRSEILATRMCPLVLGGLTTCQWAPEPGNRFSHRACQSWNKPTVAVLPYLDTKFSGVIGVLYFGSLLKVSDILVSDFQGDQHDLGAGTFFS